MNKKLLFSGVIGLLLVSCAGKEENNEDKEKLIQDSIRIEQLTSDYNEAANFNDSLMLLMGDIYNGLDSINMQEGLLYNIGNNGESGDRRAEIRKNLNAIRERLANNKRLLAEMEKKVKAAEAASGKENTILTKTIKDLQARLESQDQKILALEQQLVQTRDSIVHLTNEVAETKQRVVEETQAKEAAQQETVKVENQMNTVYYAIGTKKELQNNNIIESKFLRSTKVMQGDFNEAYFTKGDKRTLNEISTGSKKIKKIYTPKPESSYTIVENPDKTKTIKILNPTDFWEVSPYLVVEVD